MERERLFRKFAKQNTGQMWLNVGNKRKGISDWVLYPSPSAVVTKFHKLSGLKNNRNLYFHT